METDLFNTPGQLKEKNVFLKQSIEPALHLSGKVFLSPLKLAQPYNSS